MRMHRRRRRIGWTLVVGFVLVLVWDQWVGFRSKRYTSTAIEAVPSVSYGVILGTSPWRARGQANPFYRHRLEAAVTLYRAGKVDTLIISGHRTTYYDEPGSFRKDLIAQGVPADRIVMDITGDRTWASVRYLRKKAAGRPVIIISQSFHNERAVFIARWMGIEAYGFNAAPVKGWAGWKVRLREVLARLRMVYDLLLRPPDRP